MKKIAITAAALAALAIAGCQSTGTTATHVAGSQPASASTAPAAAAGATPKPDGTYTGSCDVSLSDSISGQNYLTADVSLKNTGNVGTITRVRVSWGQQGFTPLTKTRTVRVRYHAARTVHLHYPATMNQVSRFQDVQLASSSGDGCTYHAANTSTFGPAH